MLNQKVKATVHKVHPNSDAGESRLKRRGHGDVNSEIFAKLYFSTSSRSALPDHAENPERLKQAAQISMKSFNQGRGYMKNTAPAPQRSMCTYASQYTTLPLDDAPVQKQMAQLIAQSSRQGSNQVVEGLKIGSDTTAKAFYGQYGDKPMKVEPAVIFKPEGAININRNAQFLESKSVFQRDYRVIDPLVQKKFQNEVAKRHDHIQRYQGGFNDMTTYRRDVGKERIGRYAAVPKSQSAGDILQRERALAAFSGRR